MAMLRKAVLKAMKKKEYRGGIVIAKAGGSPGNSGTVSGAYVTTFNLAVLSLR